MSDAHADLRSENETGAAAADGATQREASPLWARMLPWLLTAGCFYFAYLKVSGAAAREGQTAYAYVTGFLGDANWGLWLALMAPYSVVFFLIDSFAVTRTIYWFNAPVRYREILPVRASSYILAILSEQVGKGAMALYLNRRNGVPGWEVGSSMVFIALVELYQLSIFASLGAALDFDLVSRASGAYAALPFIFGVAALYAPLHLLFFSGRIFPDWRIRDLQIFSVFRRAKLWQYGALIAIKAPNLLLAVVVYQVALGLFQIEVSFTRLLASLPVIFLAASVPLPFHAAAYVLWPILFPDYAQVAIFSMVMHTFFVVFNAAIGLVFLPRANRELFGGS